MASKAAQQTKVKLTLAKMAFAQSRKPGARYVECLDTEKRRKRDCAYWARVEAESAAFKQAWAERDAAIDARVSAWWAVEQEARVAAWRRATAEAQGQQDPTACQVSG